MIMTITLLTMLLIAAALSLVGGVAFVVVFGDVLVFGGIVALLVKLLKGKKKS